MYYSEENNYEFLVGFNFLTSYPRFIIYSVGNNKFSDGEKTAIKNWKKYKDKLG